MAKNMPKHIFTLLAPRLINEISLMNETLFVDENSLKVEMWSVRARQSVQQGDLARLARPVYF